MDSMDVDEDSSITTRRKRSRVAPAVTEIMAAVLKDIPKT
jgi:hypothetical protein